MTAEAVLKVISTKMQLVRPLKILVPLIQEDIRGAERAAEPHYAAAGIKLWEAKVHFGDDSRGFNAWATKNFNRSQETIRTWMIYAVEMNGGQPLQFQQDRKTKPASVPQPKHFPTLSAVTHPNRLSHHGPAWQTPVQQVTNRINLPRMMQERQDKEKEAWLRHRLGLQLIDIGYKVLATKLHPDKGGSREAMSRLNAVRDTLKGAI